jgi:predicted Zn-dependent peptidase
MKTFKLSNGLEVCFHEIPNATDTRVQIAYRFGSNAERGPLEAGLAHVVEHMIFKGTKGSYDGSEARVAPDLVSNAARLQFSETDIVRCARLMGASFNAFTTVNKTSYYFQTEKDFTLPFLLILSSSMFRSRMDEQMLFSEKKAVLEEMYAGKDSLVRFALKTLRKKMYKKQDAQFYPTIGTEAAVVALDGNGLRAFYDRNYNPNNATLFVTGAIVPQLENTVRELFDQPVSSSTAFEPSKPCSRPPAATTEDKEFHALPTGHSVAVVAARVGGAWKKPLRSKAWSFLTNFYGGRGTRSPLWLTFVQDGTADSASVFTDIDRHTGEVYFVIDYGSKPALEPKELRAKIEEVWNTAYNVEDFVEFKAADELAAAHQRGNLESFTNEWVEEHYKVGTPNGTLPNTAYTLDALTNEVRDVRANALSLHVLRLQSSSGGESDHSSHEALVSKLAQRTKKSVQEAVAIGSPMRDAFKRCWGYLLELSSPPTTPQLAHVGSQWSFVSQRDAALTQLAVRPCAFDAVRATEKGYALSLMGAVIQLALDPSHYDREGLSVKSNGLATVGVTTADKDPEVLDAPTSMYGSAMGEDTENFVVDWWESNGEKILAQWENALAAAMHDPTQIVNELQAKANSDAYLPIESKIRVATNFSVVDYLVTYQTHWSAVQSALFFGDAVLPNKKRSPRRKNEPRFVREPDEIAGGDVHQSVAAIGGGVRLNQALVSVGRPGSLAEDEDSVQRRLVQIILFHSLGSRLLTTMREFGGDVYTASGAFSIGATKKCCGHDQITLRVSPGSEERMMTKLLEFTTSMLDPFTADEVMAARQIVGSSIRSAFEENNLAWSWVARGDDLFEDVESHIMTLNGVTPSSLTKWAVEKLSGEWMTSVTCF